MWRLAQPHGQRESFDCSPRTRLGLAINDDGEFAPLGAENVSKTRARLLRYAPRRCFIWHIEQALDELMTALTRLCGAAPDHH